MARIKIGMNGDTQRFIGDYHFEENVLVIDKIDGTKIQFKLTDIDYFVINGCRYRKRGNENGN